MPVASTSVTRSATAAADISGVGVVGVATAGSGAALGVPDAAGPAPAAGADADAATATGGAATGTVTGGAVDGVVTGEVPARAPAEPLAVCDPAVPVLQALSASQDGPPVGRGTDPDGNGGSRGGPGVHHAFDQTDAHDGRHQRHRFRELGGTDPDLNHVLKCRVFNTVLSTHG